MNDQANLKSNKLPFYLKLREATIRDIELTPDERRLVNIRNDFDKIRKNENALNSWLIYLKHKISRRRRDIIMQEHNRLLGLDESPTLIRKGSSMKRKLSLKKNSSSKINQNLSFIVHHNKVMTDRKSIRARFANRISVMDSANKSMSISHRRIKSNISPMKTPNIINRRKAFFSNSKFSKDHVS